MSHYFPLIAALLLSSVLYGQLSNDNDDADKGVVFISHKLLEHHGYMHLYDEEGHLVVLANSIEFITETVEVSNSTGEPAYDDHIVSNVFKVTDDSGVYLFSLRFRKPVTERCPPGTTFTIIPDRAEGDLLSYTVNGKTALYHTLEPFGSPAKYDQISLHQKGRKIIAHYRENNQQRSDLLNFGQPQKVLLSADRIASPARVLENERSGLAEEVPGIPCLYYRENQKYGIYSYDFSVLTPPLYDSIFYYSPTLIGTVQGDQFGVIDLETGAVIPAKFPSPPTIVRRPVYPYNFGQHPDKTSLLGSNGNWYNPHIASIDVCQSGETQWGICHYDSISQPIARFPVPEVAYIEESYGTDPMFISYKGKQCGIVDAFGKQVVPMEYSSILPAGYMDNYHEDEQFMYELYTKKKWMGLFIPDRGQLIPARYSSIDMIMDFSLRHFPGWSVTRKKMQGVLNPDGSIKIPLAYSFVELLEHDMHAPVLYIGFDRKKKYSIFDEDGQSLLPETYKYLDILDITDQYGDVQTLIVAQDKNERLIRLTGFDTVCTLRTEGYEYDEYHHLIGTVPAFVDAENGKLGLISFENEVLFPFEYDSFYLADDFQFSTTPILIGEKNGRMYPRVYDKPGSLWLPVSFPTEGYTSIQDGRGVIKDTDGSATYYDLLTGTPIGE